MSGSLMPMYPVLMPIPRDTAATAAQRVNRQRAYARLALRRCAHLSQAPENGWRKDADDVPLPQEGYYWSVSHKKRWAAAVIGDRPIGIDIEHIAPRRATMIDALADHAEWEVIGDRSWHAFFRLWTAKEAALKANGVGIGQLSACRLLEVRGDHHMIVEYGRRPWRIEHYYHDDHVAAVTCDGAAVNWCVLNEENVEKSKANG